VRKQDISRKRKTAATRTRRRRISRREYY
jgi:hypothetical protein